MKHAGLAGLGALFMRFARPYWRSLSLMALISVAAALVSSVQPLVLAPAVDTALLSQAQPAASIWDVTLNNLGPTVLAVFGLRSAPGSFRLLAWIAALYVAVASLAAALNFAALHLMRRIRTKIARDLQAAMFQKLLSLSMSFFNRRQQGELASRFQNDAVRTAESFDPVVRGVLEASIQLTIYALILFRTDPALALAVAALTGSHVAITRLLQNQIRDRVADAMDTYASVSARINEAIQSIRVIKCFSAEKLEQQRLHEVLARLKRSMIKYSFYSSSEMPLRDVANAVILAAALLVSFMAVSQGRLTLPGFVLFVVVVRQATIPFSQLNSAVVLLHSMVGSSERVREILAAEPSLKDGALEAAEFRSAISLEDVSFEYLPGARVLNDVSLQIRRGEVIALVGPSGAGKSTLADLILRLYDPTSGRITYDGEDVRNFRQGSYRSRFGVVPQEPLLFNASIEANIAYGRALEHDRVVRAARIANAEPFILGFPDAYRTVVGDRGIRLSGGERQRIALARAVYGRPDILLLDEATSSLDSEAEQEVQRGIDQVLEATTAIVIAHRLSTIIKSHRIVVLEAGRIQAVDSHARLLKSNALYLRLFRLQFGDAADWEAVAPGESSRT